MTARGPNPDPVWKRGRQLAGILDSALSSFATFVIGVFAVRELTSEALATYAIAFSAIFLLGIVSQSLIFVPYQAKVVEFPPEQRLGHIARSARVGISISAAASLPFIGLNLFVPHSVPSSTVVAIAVPAAIVATLSPVQDHVRRMLHSSGKSWWAVGVSVVQLLVASAAILIAVAIDLPDAWIPLSALALANGLSLSAISIVLLRLRFRSRGYRVGSLVEQGFPLLWSSLPSPLAGFIGTWLVGLLAGAEALGYAEAARIVAQPLLVLTLGLAATYEPRSMEFALEGRRLQARHVSRQFSRAVVLVAVVFVIWFGQNWRLNPFSLMTPTAYAIPGLVALSVVANASYSLYFPYRAELIAMRRTRRLFWIEAGGSIFHVAAASTAVWIGSFAQPTSFFCSGAFRSGFARAEADHGYQGVETVHRANGDIQ